MLRYITLAGLLALPLLLAGCGGEAKVTGSKEGEKGTASSTAETPKSTAGKKRLIFLTNVEDDFWNTCRAGLEEGAKTHDLESAGLTVVMDKNNQDAEGQISKLRQYGSESDVAGVAISVIRADNKAIATELRNLQKKGIKVITVDGDVNRDKYRDARTYYIGTDNHVGGLTLGTATKSVLESRKLKSGGYVQFVGATDNDNARARMDGFKEAVGKAFEEKDRMADEAKHGKALENVRFALDKNPDGLAALVGIWAYNAPAIAKVVEERKVREQVTVATFDAAADAIQAMDKGNIDVMVVQNPFEMGVQTVRLLKAMVTADDNVVKEMFPNSGKPDGDVYTTGLRVIVPSEASPIKADLFDPKIVEFMTLPKLKEWLAKYKLTCT
jgi:ribose transport system substrate-binding protein